MYYIVKCNTCDINYHLRCIILMYRGFFTTFWQLNRLVCFVDKLGKLFNKQVLLVFASNFIDHYTRIFSFNFFGDSLLFSRVQSILIQKKIRWMSLRVGGVPEFHRGSATWMFIFLSVFLKASHQNSSPYSDMFIYSGHHNKNHHEGLKSVMNDLIKIC